MLKISALTSVGNPTWLELWGGFVVDDLWVCLLFACLFVFAMIYIPKKKKSGAVIGPKERSYPKMGTEQQNSSLSWFMVHPSPQTTNF